VESIIERSTGTRILSIDPGTSNAGFTVLDVPVDEVRVDLVFTKDLARKQAMSFLEERPNHIAEGFKSHMGYVAFFKELIRIAQPDVVVCEDAYAHMRPQAFRVLVQQTASFRRETYMYDVDLPFIFFSPGPVKNAIGVKGNSNDKDLMLAGLKSVQTLSYGTDICLESMSEHQVDSTAVGLCFIKERFGEDYVSRFQ